MNKKQRIQNRETAKQLRVAANTCENCGEHGVHWVRTQAYTLEDALLGRPDKGFWTCPKYYGADGRRIDASGAGG